MANVLRDQRQQSYITHSLLELCSQRVFQIASGYEDSNDLRIDPISKMSCDNLLVSENNLGSQPTMCWFENVPSRTDLYRRDEALVDIFIDSYKRAPCYFLL